MWVLKRIQEGPSENASSAHYLLVGEHYVGRKGCAIQVGGDQTVSRKHACITVSHTGNTQASAAQVTVTDLSKFGTFVNKVKCQNSVNVGLKDGDVVTFGCQNSSYRLSFEPLVVFASCLDNSKKKLLKTNIEKLGGYMVSEWQKECTHLVMDALSFTIKVIYALVTCCPIVKSSYFEDILQHITSNSEVPLAKSYMPPIKEALIDPNLVSFHPNEERKSIFFGQTFLFLDETQYKRLAHGVTLAGGKALLKEKGDISCDDHLLTDVNTLVISMDLKSKAPADQEVWIGHVWDVLTSCNKRPIPETEVGLAILHLSLKEYCNPDLDHIPHITKRIVSKSLSTMEAMSQRVNESQNISVMSEKKPLSVKTKEVGQSKPHSEAKKRSRASSSDSIPLVNETPLSEDTINSQNKRQKISSSGTTKTTYKAGDSNNNNGELQVTHVSQSLEGAGSQSSENSTGKRGHKLKLSKSETTHISQSEEPMSSLADLSGKTRQNPRVHPPKSEKSDITHISQSLEVSPLKSEQRPEEMSPRLREEKCPAVKSEITHISQSPESHAPTDNTLLNLAVNKHPVTHVKTEDRQKPCLSEKADIHMQDIPSISMIDQQAVERKRRRSNVDPQPPLFAEVTKSGTSRKSEAEIKICETPSPEISSQGKRRRVSVGLRSDDITHISDTERSINEANTSHQAKAKDISFDFDFDNSFNVKPSKLQENTTSQTKKKAVITERSINETNYTSDQAEANDILFDFDNSFTAEPSKLRENVITPTHIKKEVITEIQESDEDDIERTTPPKRLPFSGEKTEESSSTENEPSKICVKAEKLSTTSSGSLRNGVSNRDEIGNQPEVSSSGIQERSVPSLGWMSKKSTREERARAPMTSQNNAALVVKEEPEDNEADEYLNPDPKSSNSAGESEQEKLEQSPVVIKEEADLPSHLICVEFVELVVHKAAPRKNYVQDETDATNTTSTLKNTKRFRKQHYAGDGVGLPKIIGGNDLEAFTSRNTDVQDWFIEVQQMNRKKDLEDQDADDLFRYEPTKKQRTRR